MVGVVELQPQWGGQSAAVSGGLGARAVALVEVVVGCGTGESNNRRCGA